MSLVLVDNGESIVLQLITNKLPTTENLVLRLFTNNITPSKTDVVGTYIEASGFGYVNITLIGASWTVSGTTQIAYAQQVFTFTGALGNVYGYYYTRAITGDLFAAERFSVTPNIANNGDQIKITPTITAD